MTSKQFVKKTIIYFLGVMLLITLVVLLVDPFVHYHAPYFGLAACETDERGAQVGIARNTDYDVALIGTSMSENFVESWFNCEPFGTKAVKLCMQGAHFDDFDVLLNEVLQNGSTKTVLFSLDNYILLNVPSQYPTTIPEYLREPKLSTEVYYLWNKSVVSYFLPIFLLNNIRDGYTADNAYVWAPMYSFDKYVTRASYNPLRVLKQEEEEPFDTYFAYAQEFIDGMTPYIEENPDVEFIFYAPPYSVLYWDDSVRHGRLTAEICALNEVYKSLLSHENVRIFYFQDQYEITSDLNNYKDYSHYSQAINRLMFECMRDGVCEVNADTYYDTLLDFATTAAEYDYESAFH